MVSLNVCFLWDLLFKKREMITVLVWNCWYLLNGRIIAGFFFPANFFIGWHGSFKICDEDYCSANSGVIRVLIISMVSISMLHYLVSADLTFPYDSFPWSNSSVLLLLKFLPRLLSSCCFGRTLKQLYFPLSIFAINICYCYSVR